MTETKVSSIWPTLIALIVGTISVVLGVLNWKLPNIPDPNFGLYLGMFALSFATVLIPSIYFYFQRTAELRNELTALIQGAEIETVANKQKLFKQLVGGCSAIEVYGDVEILYRLYKETGVKIGKETRCNMFAYGGVPKSPHKVGNFSKAVVKSSFPIQAIFFLTSSNVASDVILFPSEIQHLSKGWLHFSYSKVANRFRTSYQKVVGRNAVLLEDSSSPEFSEKAIIDFLEEYDRDWVEFPISHRRLCRFGNEVGVVQRELTETAKSVDALDMSALEIWLPNGRIYDVVEANRKLTQERGGVVRRIFIVESRNELNNNPEEKELLCRVLANQRQNGITAGVVYRDKIDPGDVKDFAIYEIEDGFVAWVETLRLRSGEDGSSGYFTSSKTAVKEQKAVFQRLWDEQSPLRNAQEILPDEN